MNQSTRKMQIAVVMLVMALAFATRTYLALNVKTCLDGDESTVGVMAFHVEDRGEHPLFLYGQTYGGGHSVEAHLAAVLNRMYGRSVFHVELLSIIGFAAFAGLAALMGLRVGGLPLGALLGLQIVFAPQFMRPPLRASGYMETLSLMMGCCLIFHARMMARSEREEAPPDARWGLLMGVMCGLAWWWQEFSAPMTAALFIAYAYHWRRKALPVLGAWLVAFPVGASAVIYGNVKQGFANFGHLSAGTPGAEVVGRSTVLGFFTRDIPGFFQNDMWGYYPSVIPRAAWLLFAATLIGITCAIFLTRKRENEDSPLPGFGVFYCLLFIAIYIVSPFRGETARHLLPLEPFLSMGLCMGVIALFRSRKAIPAIVAVLLLAAMVTADARAVSIALHDDRIGDGIAEGVACHEMTSLVSALETLGVNAVFTERLLKWMILFRTDERIKAADVNLPRNAFAWSEYEDDVTAAERPAFVFNRRDPHVPWLFAYMKTHRIPARVGENGRYVIVMPDVHVSQFDFVEWSKRTHEAQRK